VKGSQAGAQGAMVSARLPDGRLRLEGLNGEVRVRLYDLDGREHPEILPKAGVWEYPMSASSVRIVRVQDVSARRYRSMVVF